MITPLDWLEILLTVFFVLFLRFFIIALVRVKGRSMLPTLQNGSILLMHPTKKVHRGDVIICHYPNRWMDRRHLIRQNFVKRVIALPGETIEIIAGTVYINGLMLSEPYLDPERNRFPRTRPPRTLGADEYYVMGDHRDASSDSRSIGPIKRPMLVGKVLFSFRPFRRL